MAKSSKASRVFNTDRRIRLGIWGLGRGMSFYSTCKALNIDVVAGCDYNEHMRVNFLNANPGAYVTSNADEFLAQDFDAVLLATFCPAHAADAIKCVAAGKHVLSEVTAFHTLAEGVALVEAVEKSGKVYNLAENYPWTPANMWLARKWKEGLFGELQYAEFEYVHECRTLVYTYIDGKPVMPGNQMHSWRSWLNFHYYNTHSLGPAMIITGTRPVRTSAMPGTQRLAGYPCGDARGMGGIGASLITMNNGGIVRNLMGSTTNDVHASRLWGTLGSAQNTGNGLQLRLGGSGGSPLFKVNPSWDSLGALAAKTGHGGGDFWVLYYFARQILFGEKSPWDIYDAADVTIPGIQAYRSSLQDGQPLDCPDFRIKAQRDKYRKDDWRQEHLDPRTWAFPATADIALTGEFSSIMKELIIQSTNYRAVADWMKIGDDAELPDSMPQLLENFIANHKLLVEIYKKARTLLDAYPTANAARVIREMLVDVGQEETAISPQFLTSVKRWCNALRKKVGKPEVIWHYTVSQLLPKPKNITKATLPGRNVRFKPAALLAPYNFADVRGAHLGQDGLLYVSAVTHIEKPYKGKLLYGTDGPVRVWLNGKPISAAPKATNPMIPGQYNAIVTWKKGKNEVLFALDTNNAMAWGVLAALG